MTEYVITADEFTRCTEYVMRVQTRSNRNGYNHANARQRCPGQRLFDDVNGHCGEIAFCRYLGIDWTPDIDAFHARPDVLGVFEVRTTHYAHGRLIIRSDEDAAGRCFVLVTGNAWEPPCTMTLRGYLWGQEAARFDPRAAQRRPQHDGGVALFIPQSMLRPFTADTRKHMLEYAAEKATA